MRGRRPAVDGLGCHAGKDDDARGREGRAGSSETLERYAATIRSGPHDQPQSMCPAFGSLARRACACAAPRRMLSGSACCVYGLTFTSHFYGARRTVGYVPFNSETLVTGKLFEDIREAVFKLADPDQYDAIVIINLCVPTASGVPLRLLPKEIDGVRIIGIDVPGFGVPTHAEAKDVLAGAMLRYRAPRGGAGACAGAARPAQRQADRHAARRDVPGRPGRIGGMLDLMGLAAGPVVPTREWRELYGALDCAAVAAIHPFYTASVREFEPAGRPVVGSAPVGVDGTAAWLEAIGAACSVAPTGSTPPRRAPARDPGRARREADRGRITLSGYEGSELLVARLMVESGADVRYVGTACPRTRLSAADREWLEANGVAGPVPRLARGGLAALDEYEPDLAIGTTPVVQTGEGAGDPRALLHQPDLRASADGRGRRRLARQGRQRRDRQQGPLRRHARLLRGRRRQATPRASGRRSHATGRSSGASAAPSCGRQAPRSRRWARC